jgi:hypothetical protein
MVNNSQQKTLTDDLRALSILLILSKFRPSGFGREWLRSWPLIRLRRLFPRGEGGLGVRFAGGFRRRDADGGGRDDRAPGEV